MVRDSKDTSGPVLSFGPGAWASFISNIKEGEQVMQSVPPTTQQPTQPGLTQPMRRPPAVIAAVVLMAPAAVTWLVAGIGFMVAISRLEGDALFLFWILAVAILGLCLLVTLMTVAGMRHAWRGRSTLLRVPAGFTAGLFVLALINLLVQRKLSYSPTMLTPLVVGGMAALALGLLKTRAATTWFAHAIRT